MDYFAEKIMTTCLMLFSLLEKSSKAQEHCMDIDVQYSKCKEKGIHVRKEDIRLILSTLDPLGTEMRRKRRLYRRAYFSKGPNFIWHVDSYDKLKPFGICINGAIDGFARRILWLNAYCTSSDPQVIGGYFLETVRSLGGCPRILRADMGTENSTIRDMQRYLRRSDDDPLAGERSFIYGKSTANQRIESWWGILRKECVDLWLEYFHQIKDEGKFDGSWLDKNLVLFCFLGLIQVNNDSLSLSLSLSPSLSLFHTQTHTRARTHNIDLTNII